MFGGANNALHRATKQTAQHKSTEDHNKSASTSLNTFSAQATCSASAHGVLSLVRNARKMAEVSTADLVSLASAGLVAGKCQSEQSKNKEKQEMFSLTTTGDKKTNQLLSFLQCQVKAVKTCDDKSRAYTKCHQSFMGTGSYQGRKHCGLEMQALWECVIVVSSSAPP